MMSEMPRFTIVLPFAVYDGEVRESLAAVSRLGRKALFDLILVWNNPHPLDEAAREDMSAILKGRSFRILPYGDSLGPSQAWCHGLKQAGTEYVCFLAVDAPVAPGWDEAVIAGVDGAADMYQGGYSGSSRDDMASRLERAIDRVRFEDLGIVDFRNFIVKRETALRILDEYFRGMFFSDVELQILRTRLPGTWAMKKIPEAGVVNFYPPDLLSCVRRKFRHGVNVGHIYRRFPGPGLREKIGSRDRKRDRRPRSERSNPAFIFRTISRVEGIQTKLALIAMHKIFFGAALLGAFLPDRFARRFYIMHFDGQDNARKISEG